ncbi:MAG: cyanophycinase [Polyangiaceae bacterium]
MCTSAFTASCAGSPAFSQETALPLRTDEGQIYVVTADSVARMKARPELSSVIKAGLDELPQDVELTYDQMLDELDIAIGLSKVPNGSDQRALILGFTAIRQEEVVSLPASSAPTRAIFEEIVASSGGKGAAVIGVVSASSGDGFDSYEFHRQVFLQAGAKEVRWVPVNLAYRLAVSAGDCEELEAHFESEYQLYDAKRRYPELFAEAEQACQDPAGVVSLVDGLSGVFFTGGDQAKHKGSLISQGADSAEMAALRARHEAGQLLVAGTSAGTAVMAPAPSRPMVTGGESYNALVWGAYETACSGPSGDICQDDLTFDAGGGLGLFTYGLLDTHFSERGRQARIVRLAADTKEDRAFGVDENTALIVRDAGTEKASMAVIGEHGAFVFDLRAALVEGGPDFAIKGVRASYLTSGDTYDPASWSVTFAADKVDIQGDESFAEPLSPSGDILSSPNNSAPGGGRKYPREWALIAQDLCDSEPASTYGLSYEGPDLSSDYPLVYAVDMVKEAETRCFDGPAKGDVAFADMTVDISPY